MSATGVFTSWRWHSLCPGGETERLARCTQTLQKEKYRFILHIIVQPVYFAAVRMYHLLSDSGMSGFECFFGNRCRAGRTRNGIALSDKRPGCVSPPIRIVPPYARVSDHSPVCAPLSFMPEIPRHHRRDVCAAFPYSPVTSSRYSVASWRRRDSHFSFQTNFRTTHLRRTL
jgi:hypothetical protein